jgi:copper chaperone
MTDTTTRHYAVAGMTCGHCRAAVVDEVERVDGVEAVEVDLERGAVTVSGRGFSDEAIAAAVEEAGYEVVGTP